MHKVALLIPNLAGGGAERVVSRLSRILNKDFDIYLALFSAEIVQYEYEGQMVDLQLGPANGFFGKILNIYARSKKLRQFKKQYKIDTTVSFLSTANLVNVLNKKGDRVIVSVRNYVSHNKGLYGTLHKWLIRFLYSKADLVVAVSNVLKSDLVQNYGIPAEKIKVIYNPYEFNTVQGLVKEQLDDTAEQIFKKPVIINVGRLEDQKGHDTLIKVFSELRKKGWDVKLVILGEDLGLGEYLEQVAKDCGVAEHVHFLGFQKNPYKYISRSKLYVLSSHYEGFPNALVEAMICRTPVLSVDCLSGPREILAPSTDILKRAEAVELAEYGVLVPQVERLKDAFGQLSYPQTKMLEGMERILGDEELRQKYIKAGEQRVKDFSFENVLVQWKKIL